MPGAVGVKVVVEFVLENVPVGRVHSLETIDDLEVVELSVNVAVWPTQILAGPEMLGVTTSGEITVEREKVHPGNEVN